MIGLATLSSVLGNLEGVDELTFTILVVGIGELGPECELRASCASEKTSSSASDASETTVSNDLRNVPYKNLQGTNTHLNHEPQGPQAQRSCEEGLESGS